MRPLCLAALAALILLSWRPTVGYAQARKPTAAKEPAGYREAIDTALQEVELGNYEEAREQFARAHGLFPNARTLRGLGISEFELRHYVVALGHLEQALASQVKPIDGSMRRDTEALLVRAKTYVGELTLSLSPGFANAVVDGARTVDPSQRVLLEVGDHVLEFRADGYATERREVTVHGGEAQQLTVRMAQLVAKNEAVAETRPTPVPASPAEPRSERVPVYKRWWLWTIVGVVVVGAAAGTAIALTADKNKTEYRGVPTENTPAQAGLQPWRF